MTLARAALEDWGTLMWVERHPKNVNMFLWAFYDEIERPQYYPPKFEAIWKELADAGEIPALMYDTLSKFAHPKSIGLRWLVGFDETSTTFHYGPQFSIQHLQVGLFILIQIAQAFGQRVVELQQRMLGKVDEDWLKDGKALGDRATEAIQNIHRVVAANFPPENE